MERTLRLIIASIGLWVLASFGGAMFDPGNAGFWTQSLMVSLICAMLVLPALVMMGKQAPSPHPEVALDHDEFVDEDPVPASFFSQENPFSSASSSESTEAKVKAEPTDTLWPEKKELQNA